MPSSALSPAHAVRVDFDNVRQCNTRLSTSEPGEWVPSALCLPGGPLPLCGSTGRKSPSERCNSTPTRLEDGVQLGDTLNDGYVGMDVRGRATRCGRSLRSEARDPVPHRVEDRVPAFNVAQSPSHDAMPSSKQIG